MEIEKPILNTWRSILTPWAVVCPPAAKFLNILPSLAQVFELFVDVFVLCTRKAVFVCMKE
jgi:hypothetical protein